tara:strand:+ start:242 stop:571 length:330 start_codon:yes stop_codon:yes gene_type:complete
MAKNPLGKTRDVENPYAILEGNSPMVGKVEVRILKTYKLAKSEPGDQYARWFTAAKSDDTAGLWDYGDAYRADILANYLGARLFITYGGPEFCGVYMHDPQVMVKTIAA